ncbi:hypothetical protein BRADI_1g30882v3 [Brachypodium distachyon]|uniref:Uncharacterized protein n=1 Tax=Brachypodium distachyon TaxID=15368 RepID=A0A2K2DM75_BRADI|nr:hypothetical protein BRADI_1g30882v3 [Brachypodium distachyon]
MPPPLDAAAATSRHRRCTCGPDPVRGRPDPPGRIAAGLQVSNRLPPPGQARERLQGWGASALLSLRRPPPADRPAIGPASAIQTRPTSCRIWI